MCKKTFDPRPLRPLLSIVSPLSPSSPCSDQHVSHKRNAGLEFAQIPNILFIPVDTKFSKAAAPPQLPRRSSDTGCESKYTLEMEEEPCKEKSASIPRLPRRQESLDHSGHTEAKESSPQIPRRKVSVANFEEWLQSGEDGNVGRSPDGRRYSCPSTFPNPFQYIVDRDAGGSVPKLPQRCESIRKIAGANACRVQPSPRGRTASGHL